MNKFLYTILIIIVSIECSFSQNFESGAFAAPVLKFTKLIDQSSLVLGVKAGWIIDKKIVLGAGYYVLTRGVKTSYSNLESDQNILMNFNYGGLEFEYLLLYDTRFNISLDMLLASGGQNFYVANQNRNYGTASLLVWEPQLNLEIKLYDWLHADAGISYRMISKNYVLYGVTRDDLQGINFLLTFKIGKY
ncbi:MAG TPA: hypothetical protein VLB50_11475 [Ignavibacteriaceae bacterium]|nr:hypothetical protein [Ignavibacteriaceae bacterium]